MNQINPNIFRAYDIRGTAEITEKSPTPDLTPETAHLIGLATGTYLQRKDGIKNMIVGRDNRTHSDALQKAFIEGVLKTGINVTDIGLASSPMIYWATCFYKMDSGAEITASHNPKYDNGIKIVRKDAHSVADQELQEILKLIQANDFNLPGEPGYIHPVGSPSQPGQLTTNPDVFQDYKNSIAQITKLARPLKVVIDAGNGITGKFAPELFRSIGCEVTELYCELDGTFPNHEANPEHARNMIELGEKVRELGADLGFGFDGDGDRLGVVDENGKFYSAEYIIMLLSRDLLKTHPGEKIIFDVKVSKNLIKDIEKHGGKPIMSRTGHSFIEARIREEKGTLAGEKSGHLFLGAKHFNYYGFDDGMFAACKVAEALSKLSQAFSQTFADTPELPNLPEYKLYCPDNQKFQVVDALCAHFKKLYDCLTIDGVRINFDADSWAVIRCSNTSPYLTVFAEAPTTDRLEEIKTILLTEIKKYPQVEFPN
jgi:phosphomannomutase / phosphoglucomutase